MATNHDSRLNLQVWWRLRSIRARMILFFSLIFIIGAVVYMVVSFYGIPFSSVRGTIEIQRLESIRNLNLLADTKKEILNQWMEEKRVALRLIAADTLSFLPSIIRLQEVWSPMLDVEMSESEQLQKLRQDADFLLLLNKLEKTLCLHSDFEWMGIADVETGIVIVSTNESMLGADLSSLESFQKAGSANDIVISMERAGPDQSVPSLNFMQPIFDEEGNRVVILILDVSYKNVLLPILHTGGGLGQNGEVVLINQDQFIITNLKHPLPDGTYARPLEYRITANPAMLASTGNEGIIEDMDYRNVSVLAVYRYLPLTDDLGWGMVVKKDVDEIMTPIREAAIINLLSLSIGGLVILGATIVIAFSITRPLHQLQDVAQRVRDGDIEARTPELYEDEVGKLARTFNSMLDRNAETTAHLTAANEEMEAFTYSVSHDLRAPLRAISGFGQLLLEDHASALDDTGMDYMQRIVGASHRMSSLIDDLLRLSRIGRQEFQYSHVNLSDMARSIARELSASEPDRQVVFSIEDGLEIRGDLQLLNIALKNLLHNAWKFTQRRPQARIEFGSDDQFPTRVYYVRDNGAGFDMAYANKLFSPFQRLHSSDEFVGNGIGLVIIQRIILRHGGRIWAEAGVEKGATFFFTFD